MLAKLRAQSSLRLSSPSKSVNLKENATSVQLRDTLLPELLSGELRVPAAEKELAGQV